MSLLWKKFRKAGGGGSSSPNHTGLVEDRVVTQSPSHRGIVLHKGPEAVLKLSDQHSLTPRYITEPDEQLFLSDAGDGVEDPLMVESQFVKTVSDIFSSHSTLPYFLQFLQGWGSDKYARFWLDVTSFKASAETHIHTNDTHLYEKKLVGEGCLSDSDKGRCCNKDKTVVKHTESISVVTCPQLDVCDKSLISFKSEVSSHGKRLVLPDLVSNIKTAANVTPLNSPDGPSHVQNYVSPFPGQWSDWRSSEISDTKLNSMMKEELFQPNSEPLTFSVKGESSVMLSNSLTLSRAQKLRQSIADDALRIFQKYISQEAELSIGVDDSTREEIHQKICVTKQDISSDCFESAQVIVFNHMEKEFLPKFLASDYYLKHQIDVLTSGSVRLADILYSDSALPYFMEYVEQEGGRNMLQFWIAASNFRQQLMDESTSYDALQTQSDAMVLYDKYFSLQATCPLGYSDNVRFIVEGNICREEGPSHFCFDLPLRVVLHVLERDFLPGYLSSSLHIKYLSELINTVKTSVELLGRKKRSGSESTCSSEQSSSQGISSQNTLLAMDSAPHRFRNLDDPTLAMRIDEAQITDPDSLWRRKNFSKMSCGFINELGRFESDLQPEPDRKTESKISRTLKKFVNMDEIKVKEDMAYKVAEMIIKDVTSITLGSQHSSTRSSVTSSVPPLSPSSVSQDNLSDVFPS
ncbi:A-kinase anchor protein 10, mitochondrial-like [Macrobrachium nipponense]|uniref:A-kinase anchor protein 10, mitochondrial-like n=1 Tax=Macrobrachium nipponense TaxID=159736 RepID=UPI0030C81DED